MSKSTSSMSVHYYTTQFSRFYTMISIGIPDLKPKPRKIRITFNEEEIIINPEDVDPSVGRFRNMVESTIIPKKRPRNDMGKSPQWAKIRKKCNLGIYCTIFSFLAHCGTKKIKTFKLT